MFPHASTGRLNAITILLFTLAVSVAWAAEPKAPAKKAPAAPKALAPRIADLEFIDTSIENASPLWYEQGPDGSILVHLNYDHERDSANRAAGHIHFLLHAKKGTKLILEFKNLDNVWNNVSGSVAPSMRSVALSEDGRSWRAVALENLPGERVRLSVEMPGPKLYVARIEPYRLSDLDAFLAKIRPNPLVQITPIGRTVQGRELEILRVGNPRAPYRIFLRARAHPWEPAGNFVVQGLVRRLLGEDADARQFRERYCAYILPMANKDGVALGRTRFNLLGKDLNRNWDQPADARVSPENAALEQWLTGMIAAGQKPHFAMELHNDGGGRLHISRPPVPDLPRHLERMAFFETLLRKHTWFTEGPTGSSFQNSGTLGDGWLARFQIDAVVHEFNANLIAGLQERPLGKHWEAYGEGLAKVFYDYFGEVKP
jgi:hypothetical protein